jgi:ubiquinone/menaquinone biosynthesis C-methylase UbiE
MKNMSSNKITGDKAADFNLPVYFDLQAKMGHSKHLGGEKVTRILAEYCQLGPDRYVLNVGSGAGISAAYLVEKYNCRMMGIDILPGMVESASRWVEEKGLGERLQFQQGDAQQLPFEDHLFDAVICESVNVFVPDKEKAIREYIRVTKSGGYIGITEAIWAKEPPLETAEIIMEATGQPLLPSEVWETLFEKAGLVDLSFEKHVINLREEAQNQSALMDFWTYFRIGIRAIGSLISDRETRSLMKYISSNPKQYFDYMGYGVYVGRVPE